MRMTPYIVMAPKAKFGLGHALAKSLDNLLGKRFMNMRGGPLLDAIYYRSNFLADHPGEKAIVVVSSEPVHGRVTAATVVFTQGGELYASSAALGNRRRLSGLAAADIQDPERIGRELQSLRDFYLGTYDEWSGGHLAEDALPPPIAPDASASRSNNAMNLSDTSYTLMMSRGQLTTGAAIARAEESGDYSVLAVPGHEALMTDYDTGADPKELMDVAYGVLHDQTLLPVAEAKLTLTLAFQDESKPSMQQAEEVLVFDWGQSHYIYNPDLGTYGAAIPRNLITGLPALIVARGDVLECLHFFATFRSLHPSEKTAILPAEDGLHAAVAYTLKGRISVFSPALGRFSLPSKYDIENAAELAALHAALVARQLATGAPAPTATADQLPGDTADLQVRRAYLALLDAGFKCRLGRIGDRPALTVSWPRGEYTYTAPPVRGSP